MGSESPEEEMLGYPTNLPFFCHFLGKLLGCPNFYFILVNSVYY